MLHGKHRVFWPGEALSSSLKGLHVNELVHKKCIIRTGVKVTQCYLTLILLMQRIGWANSIPIYIQQDATLHSLCICGNCSTCFGWYLHLAHATHSTLKPVGSNSSTIAGDSSNGVTNTWCCRYSCMRSWWWVELPPKTCRAVSTYK
jgi:hypothetical protein